MVNNYRRDLKHPIDWPLKLNNLKINLTILRFRVINKTILKI
jgi:hypothetical protein